MLRAQLSFITSMLFAFLVIVAPRLTLAQDMPPILAPPVLPNAAPATPSPASPSAEAAVPPAVAPTVKRPQVAIAKRPAVTANHRVATAAEKKKFAALLKRLSPADKKTEYHEAIRHVAAHETVRRVAVHETVPPPRMLPPGMVIAPPSYYGPGPYQRLVYAGPYGGWGGFRRPYPYYNHP
jgi:hypothetical protein